MSTCYQAYSLIYIIPIGIGIYWIWKYLFKLPYNSVISNWNISWIDFFLFLWTLCFFYFVSAYTFEALVQVGFITVTKIYKGIYISLITHAIIALFLAVRLWIRKEVRILPQYSTLHTVFKLCNQSLIYGLYCIFIVMFAHYIWELLLHMLCIFGLHYESTRQSVVELLIQSRQCKYILIIQIFSITVAPFTEELIFRGYIYRFLKSHYSQVKAMLLSSILFGLLHFNLSSCVPLFVFGNLLCLVYEQKGSLLPCIVVHSLFNANSLLMLYLS